MGWGGLVLDMYHAKGTRLGRGENIGDLLMWSKKIGNLVVDIIAMLESVQYQQSKLLQELLHLKALTASITCRQRRKVGGLYIGLFELFNRKIYFY